MADVTIRSRLPIGVQLEVGDKKVEIKGVNSSMIIGATTMDTPVDGAFWEKFAAENKGLELLTNQSIFLVGRRATRGRQA
jgi:hypothetical protein